MPNENQIEKKFSLFDREDIKHFIELRKIRPEDFYLIEELSRFNKNLLIGEMHNFFSQYEKKSGEELEKQSERSQNEERKNLFLKFKEFFDRYDSYASHHLERTLENL